MFNYSFWADEAYISGIARQLVNGNFSIGEAFNGLPYQKLYIQVIYFFFKLFGVSEFVARLPSLCIFIIGSITIYFLARELSNKFGGILSFILYSFSHLNLAYATQTKPYIFLESILLLVLFLNTKLEKEKNIKKIYVYHLLTITLISAATFLHTIGVLLWIIYFAYFVFGVNIKKSFFSIKSSKYYAILAFIVITAIIVVVGTPYFSIKLFPYNHIYQTIKLFAYKYCFISISAIFGFCWLIKKNRALSFTIFLYSIVVLILVTFQQYIFNIRYVLTLFGILFLYFGIFWAKVGERYDDKFKFKIPYFAKASKGRFNFELSGKAIIPLVVIILLYATGYKIVRWPQEYYNPNIDKYGDVQIANYKDFYGELKQKFPNFKNMYVVNDTFDAEYWYFGRYSNAYFMKFTEKPYKHHTADAMVYGSLDDFKKMIGEHPQGILIMEDWQSFLPDDIKMYVKKNLKLELRVESLKEATDDPWPLALYSWGIEK